MKLVSFDPSEPGIIAIGATPIGIIAIGGLPVGVIAVGNLAAGVVSLSVGGGAGLLSISCGISTGIVAGGCGVAFAVKEATIGLGISVLPEREPEPESPQQITTTLAALERGETNEGWALIPSDLSFEKEGRALDITSGARADLAPLSQYAEVLAHVGAQQIPVGDGPSGFDYRNAVPTERGLVVDAVVAPPRKPSLVPSAWTLTKAVALFCVLCACGGAVRTRLSDLELNRRAELVWDARVRASTDQRFVAKMPCEIHSRMRTDGNLRHKAAIAVSCGGIEFLSRTGERAVIFAESTSGTAHKYILGYDDPGESPGTDSDGNSTGNTPQIELSTREHRFTMRGWGQNAYAIELDVDVESRPRGGDPLFQR